MDKKIKTMKKEFDKKMASVLKNVKPMEKKVVIKSKKK